MTYFNASAVRKVNAILVFEYALTTIGQTEFFAFYLLTDKFKFIFSSCTGANMPI